MASAAVRFSIGIAGHYGSRFETLEELVYSLRAAHHCNIIKGESSVRLGDRRR
jgi:hypothetical protein